MLFEVKGSDNKAILEALGIFNREAETEYKETIRKTQGIVRTMGVSVPLPDEWLMISWEQEGNIYVRLPLPMPKIVKAFRKHKAMCKNLKLFLQEKGFKCDVKYVGEKEEEEICSRIPSQKILDDTGIGD